MEAIQSANVWQLLAKLSAGRTSPARENQEQIQREAPRAATAQSVQEVQAPASEAVETQQPVQQGVSVKAPDARPVADPLEDLAAEAAPNYQRALVAASAQRQRLNADIQRLKAELAAKGDVVSEQEAHELVQDMQRLEDTLERHIRRLLQSDALNRLGAETPGVSGDSVLTAGLVAFVKNSQAALLLGRVSLPESPVPVVDETQTAETEPAVSAKTTTPARVLQRLLQGQLPPVQSARAEQSDNLLGELSLSGVLAA